MVLRKRGTTVSAGPRDPAADPEAGPTDDAPDAVRRELAEALEQQAATAEILGAIARSPYDTQPVFDAIVAHAARLCHAQFAFVMRHEAGQLSLAARTACTREFAAYLEGGIALDGKTTTGRAACDRRPVQVLDFMDEPGVQATPAHRSESIRTVLAIPLLRDERLLGVFTLWRREVRAFPERQIALLRSFADQAVIAIENARLFAELDARNGELAEALEQQTATSEILRVISRSPTDAQPVFDTIVRAAVTLCDSLFANVFRFDGEQLHFVASHNTGPDYADLLRSKYPMRPDLSQVAGRVTLSSSVVTLADALADPDYDQRFARALGWRRMLGVPMLREGRPIGVITVGWAGAGPVSTAQQALLQTFAEQAVIAIENARLFAELDARNRELAEALEQQTATSGILRVISRSPDDVQPVFDTIAASALRLCRADTAILFSYDGELLRIASMANVASEGAAAAHKLFPRPAGEDTAAGRAVLNQGVVEIPDVRDDPQYAIAAQVGTFRRSVVAVPLTRDGRSVGVIAVARPQPGRFSDKQIALLKIFADQSVIAIKNARLFAELQSRNRELAEALDQQTATSQILRVISQSRDSVQPVFDTIAAAALRLCRAESANVFTFDGRLVHLRASVLANEQVAQEINHLFPRPPDRHSAASRAVLERELVAIHDVLEDPDYTFRRGAQLGFRSVLGIPLMRGGEPIGAIAIGKPDPGPFPDQQVALMQTFAAQAVIAIENVRLFRELQARTAELTQSVEELRVLGEIGQALSSTLDLEAVLRTIVVRATMLAEVDGGAIFEYDAAREQFRLHAADQLPDELVAALAATPMAKGEGVIGRLALTAEPVVVSDISDEHVYRSRVRDILLRHGYRSLLAVPLLRENRVLGGLVVNRRAAGEFAPRTIELLRTFATQSALAIQNARLFREIEDKGRQLEIASRHKSSFLANMSHELRTPLNAIIGFTRIVMRRTKDQLDDKQYENLEKILGAAQHLLSLINAVLDLAKVESGKVEVHAGEVLPATLLEQCARTVEPLVKDGVRLERDFDGALPPLFSDEEKIRQIVINLLSNAAKFTAKGSIRISALADGERVSVAVTDTGTGIPADKLDAVFEEFEQVDTSSTRAHGGTGLGLAIARRLARLMGGDLVAASTLGEGSTFTLTLPLRYAAPGA